MSYAMTPDIMMQYLDLTKNRREVYLYVTPEILDKGLHRIFYQKFIRPMYNQVKRRSFLIVIEFGDNYSKTDGFNYALANSDAEYSMMLAKGYYDILIENGIQNLPTTQFISNKRFDLYGNEIQSVETAKV